MQEKNNLFALNNPNYEKVCTESARKKLAGITLQAGNLFWSGTYALDFIWALYKNIRQGEVLFSNTFSKAS